MNKVQHMQLSAPVSIRKDLHSKVGGHQKLLKDKRLGPNIPQKSDAVVVQSTRQIAVEANFEGRDITCRASMP